MQPDALNIGSKRCSPGVMPDKPLYKRGEVASIVGVHVHVLRRWESELGLFTPHRLSRRRRYTRADLAVLCEVRRQLHEEKMTLAGVRQHLVSRAAEQRSQDAGRRRTATLRRVRQALIDLIALCRAPVVTINSK